MKSGRIAKAICLFLALYASSLLLMNESAYFHQEWGEKNSVIRIDSVSDVARPEGTSGNTIWVKVSGKTIPNIGVGIGVGTREESSVSAWSDESGRFEGELEVEAGKDSIWAEARGTGFRGKRVSARIYKRTEPLTSVSARYFRDLGLLWISGETSSRRGFHVRTGVAVPGESMVGQDTFFGYADENGFFDGFFDLGKPPSVPVSVIPMDPGPDDSLLLTHVPEADSDSFPISRKVVVRLSEPWKVDSLMAAVKRAATRRERPERDAEWAFASPTDFRAVLPVQHPIMKALMGGHITAGNFFSTVFGDFHGEARMPRPIERRTRAGDVDPFNERFAGYFPKLSVSVDKSSGLATVSGEMIILVGSDLEFGGSGSLGSLGSLPLASAKDSLVVRFNGRRFGQARPMPDRMTDQEAVWTGPGRNPQGEIERNFRIGFSGFESSESLAEKMHAVWNGGPGRGEMLQAEFLDRLPDHFSGTIWSRFWRAAMALLPLLWGLSLALRLSKSIPSFNALVGLMIVLTGYRCHELLFLLLDFLKVGLFKLALYLDSHHFDAVTRITLAFSDERFWEPCLWVLLLLSAAMVPLCFAGFASGFAETKPRGGTFMKGVLPRLGVFWGSAMLFVSGQYLLLLELFMDLPVGMALGMAGFLSLPLFRIILIALLPFPARFSTTAWASAVWVACVLLFPWLPVKSVMIAGGIFLFVGLAWAVVHGVLTEGMRARLKEWMGPWWIPSVLGLPALAGLLLGWPMANGEEALNLRQIVHLFHQLGWILPNLAGLGFIAHLMARSEGEPVLDDSALRIGYFIFAGILIGTTSLWLWIPLPFIIALFLGNRLFRSPSDTEASDASPAADPPAARDQIQSALDAAFARSRLDAALDVLDQQLGKAAILPDEFNKRREAYLSHFQKAGGPDLEADRRAGRNRTPAIFSRGGPDARANLLAMLRVGGFLLVIPFLINLYRSRSDLTLHFPYPVAEFLLHLAHSLNNWLILACFLGMFYPCLKGRTGLTKGMLLAWMIILCFSVHRILGVHTLDRMANFLVFAAEIFFFLSLSGLWAGDWRLLRENGFRAKNLLLVHNLPLLSVYASTVLAAVASSLFALLTGGLKEVVSAAWSAISK